MLNRFGVNWDGRKKQTEHHPLYKKVTSNKILNTRRGNTIKSIRSLTFALLHGRKKRIFFGRSVSMDEEDWITLKSYHYDNLKVAWKPKLLYRTVYDLLVSGVGLDDIRNEYERLLLREHGVATDKGYTTPSWKPTRLVRDLRRKFIASV